MGSKSLKFCILLELLLIFTLNGCSPEWESSKNKSKDIFALNPSVEYDSLMIALKPEVGSNTVSFLWFTDIHENTDNLKRILEWNAKYDKYIDDVISTGDQMSYSYTDDFSWWGKYGAGKILQLIGNHDAWIYEATYEAGSYEGTPIRKNGAHYIMSQKDVYNLFFSNYVSDWKVTQPAYADSLGLCYYYKDYDNLRLIMLDCMHYGVADDLDEKKKSRQNKWLINVLDDAIRQNLPVIIGSHYPIAATIPTTCTYTRANSGKYETVLNNEAYKNVSRFIDNGGILVCWLAGHGHYDEIGVLEADQRQVVIRCATANDIRYTQNHGGNERQNGKKSQDSFNCISIDPSQNLIYMVKVGADVNEDGERKRIMKYRYDDYVDDEGTLYERGLICSY